MAGDGPSAIVRRAAHARPAPAAPLTCSRGVVERRRKLARLGQMQGNTPCAAPDQPPGQGLAILCFGQPNSGKIPLSRCLTVEKSAIAHYSMVSNAAAPPVSGGAAGRVRTARMLRVVRLM